MSRIVFWLCYETYQEANHAASNNTSQQLARLHYALVCHPEASVSEQIADLSACARYTHYLRNCRTAKLPPGYPRPQPPCAWPPENVALLERYLAWLIADGAGHTSIMHYYIPVAGHVLGLSLVPHELLDLERDLDGIMAYLNARQLCAQSRKLSCLALKRFRRFMEDERGVADVPNASKPVDLTCYQTGLPDWLVAQITQLQQLQRASWRLSRMNEAIIRFWSSHTRLWRWLFARYSIRGIRDIERAQIVGFIDERLSAGCSPRGVNYDLRTFRATLRFLQQQGLDVPPSLLSLPDLKEGVPLPRFLTDGQVKRLQADFEQRVQLAASPSCRRNALMDRAAFYLLWQGGLRLGEVEDLFLGDLNAGHRQLVIRRAKGGKARTVYLVDTAVSALLAYLAVRGSGATQHVFLYRHKPVGKDFLRGRMQAAGKRAGVSVTPHQLRHTYATQLLNAGCRITTIQALLGHEHLTTTMIYARVHDRTVADEYFAAMATVEESMEAEVG